MHVCLVFMSYQPIIYIGIPEVRYLCSLDVVVEVIAECLDVRYGFFSSLRGEMAGEENYSQSAPHIPNKPLRRAYRK